MKTAATNPREASGAGAAGVPIRVRRHPLVSEVAKRLREACGVQAGSRVVVGVSGGADSCALLLACIAIAGRKRGPVGEVVACHVHHHLRDEADEEAAFVENLCAEIGVAVHVEHVHPAKEGGSTSANARRLRYQALIEVAQRVGAGFIATAHHAEDQLETVLMALGRGTGLRGMRGMAWRRPMQGAALVRPMLLVRKRDCEELCTVAGVEWREDPTNVDPGSKRARIRRDVLPVLEELWPGASERSVGTAELLGAASQLLTERVEAVFGSPATHVWMRDRVAALPAPMIAEGLRRAAEQLHGGPIPGLDQRQLRRAAAHVRSDEKRPKRLEWPGGTVVEVTSKTVTITRD